MNPLDQIIAYLRTCRDDLARDNADALTDEQRRWLAEFDGLGSGVTLISAIDQFRQEFGLERDLAGKLIMKWIQEQT